VRTGRPTPDNALLTMSCASGCLASVYASFCVDDGDRYSNGLTLNYEREPFTETSGGRIRCQNQRARIFAGDARGETRRKLANIPSMKYLEFINGEFNRAIVNTIHQDSYIQKIVEGVKFWKPCVD